MKRLLIILVAGLFAITVSAQTFVYQNDTAVLSLSGFDYGELVWQSSPDSVNWLDIPGATLNPYKLVPATSKYYRAKITQGQCNPYYSIPTYIEVRIFACGDILEDYRDVQTYPTVQIGTQCWMAKNLNVGQMIINGSAAQADNQIIEKYCNSNDSNKCATHGGLYTWDEMMQYSTTESVQGICPVGWHVPSDPEWIQLEVALGMDAAVAAQINIWRGTDQGTQMLAGGSSGYNGLLSGSAIPGGAFSAFNQYEYMYSSTVYGGNAWRRCLRVGDPQVGRWNTFPRSYALSVRCVKN
ncbi:MAG: fibrobacter succinogenes major paralogous domain-containing protein [Bacteroidetes bacterium]|nr:fibrobacter succinogenes major paralogous domain-containing protein [Bacteroidota bacterium]MBU1719256.1 fibrobacter succinogenes major paralogous domain-containing protein [Bacteroidota bacterium]